MFNEEAELPPLRPASHVPSIFARTPEPQTRNMSAMIKRTVIALALICSTAFAADTKPSTASLQELLKVTESAKLLDGVAAQIDGMMKNMAAQATKGQTPTPAQAKAFETMQGKMAGLMKEELSWAKYEPIFIQVYGESFTQEEIDSMIAFYHTPGGQALVKKMPVVMQRTMQIVQQHMGPMMQKFQAIAQESQAEMQGASAPAAAAPAATPEPAAAK